MRQILQSLSSGETALVPVPVPVATRGMIVVESRASVVSAGTERMLVEFGRSNLLEKARRQPERVVQVLDRIRTDGVAPTLEAVRSKLNQPIPLGYCNAGVVREVGAGVARFALGDRVVTNGPHAEYVRAPETLSARIPDRVPFDAAAFAPLAAVGLQGFRLAAPTLGETVVVYGLGLLGLLTVQIARAGGCRVIGIDRLPERLALAERFGAECIEADERVDAVALVKRRTAGVGADAVLLTLDADSNEPVRLAAEMSRKRGRLVLVGVTGLDLRRKDFYEKELTFQVSCSFGPGRYDPKHEEGGSGYPLPFVRWTEGRNFAAVLDLMADGRLDPLPLASHRFPFDEAARAYDVITGPERALGVVLEYAEKESEVGASLRVLEPVRSPVPRDTRATSGAPVVGLLGAGNFASRMLTPALAAAGVRLRAVVSSGGTSGAVLGGSAGFERIATDPEAVFQDPEIDTVFVATRHDTHAHYVLRALAAGKHVFVEKPLALSEEDVERVAAALAGSDRILCVGFNRRFAPHVVEARSALAGRAGPLVVNMTVNAGAVPADHWTRDPEVGGGRLLGEGCHFIDLARHLVGHPIEELHTASASNDGERIEDVSVLQTRFRDGSLLSLQYLANGPSAFPKERIELFWDGRALRIDNFRRLLAWKVPGQRFAFGRRQDKGHRALVSAFLDAVRSGGPPPIPHEEILEVSRWSVRAARV